ncbi:MAG: redox-regulated ATPase YchF [Bacilli bacterium]|nr:redox-regulated ATPase YchF [Bacilli bacterium]
MSLTAGIVGLPNVGKSTLFNAITKQSILAANYPFATIEPNQGMVTVPDRRVDFLEKLYKPKKVIPATFEFTDIAGLVEGASKGEGLGNKFLSHIREVDAIVEVVRCFDDDNVTHVTGNVDPLRDVSIIELELILADLEVVENRLDRIGRKAKLSNDKEAKAEVLVLEKVRECLLSNKSIRTLSLSSDEYKILKPFNFLTIKPIIYVANVSEDEVSSSNEYVKILEDFASKEESLVIVICAKIEAELSELDDDERLEFLKELGINESGLDKLIKSGYSLLGLETFLTAGPDEVRAWTFKKGMKAPECAGIIHTDFMKGFIKAEIMSFADLEKYGTESKVKEAGKLRLEGKEYVMQDGDICYFRFNV